MQKKWLLAALLAAVFALPAHAVDVHGVAVAETARVEGGNLVLNGAGVRTKFFIKVYVGALYLIEKRTGAEAVLSSNNTKRMELHILHAMSSEKLISALDDGMAANNEAAELAALDNELKQFRGLITAGGAIKEGDTIQLDYAPASGTHVVWNGKVLGNIAGEKFYRVLLKIWLGDHPVDNGLKKALLGG